MILISLPLKIRFNSTNCITVSTNSFCEVEGLAKTIKKPGLNETGFFVTANL